MMRSRFAFAGVVLAIAALLIPVRGFAPAAAQDQPKPTKLVLSTKPALDDKGHPVKGQYKVIATLTTADGRFVAKGSVHFVEHLEFFGPNTSDLGSATTNGTGIASVIYQPSQKGKHTIFAQFGGNDQYAASDEQFVIDATDVVPPFPNEAPPLASVGRWLSIALAILGIGFWAVLLGVVGRTVRTIRAASGLGPSLMPGEKPLRRGGV